MYWLLASGLTILGLAGPILTLVGLPGTWWIIALALVAQWIAPETFSWWTLGLCVIAALAGEAIEFAAGAVGSRSAGGTRSSSMGALMGGIIGAIAGAAFPPLIGAIIWGVVGAGIGAILGELAAGNRNVRSQLAVGGGAAAGKAVGTVVKSAICTGVYVLIVAAAFIL